MFRALIRRLRRTFDDPAQLPLSFDVPPRNGEELLERLRALGLTRIEHCRLTRNRHVMVSFRGTQLRVHEGYLAAPEPVLRAIVQFTGGPTRADRREGRRVIISYRVPNPGVGRPAPRERTRAEDEPLAARLQAEHARLNAERFGGELGIVPVRVSRRMKSRLGHFAPSSGGAPGEIAMSRRHIRRHGWTEVIDTLVHEMVHQWQVETGRPLNHGAEFRRKARQVGAAPRATRAPEPHP